MRVKVFGLLPGLVLIPFSTVWAQQVPSYLNNNDVERNLPVPNLPADAYRPGAAPAQLPTPRQQALPLNGRIQLNNVMIEGGTVYPFEELAALYNPMIGKEVTLRDLMAATRTITRRYQRDGYALSYAFLPAQGFANGQVRVVLVEGYVQEHEMQGEIGSVAGYIDKLAAKLLEERPLTRKTFDRYTTLMAQIPGVSVRASVAPPTTTDGATRLITTASRKPFTANASINDDSRDDLQAVLSVSSNSHTSLGEQVTVSALVPPGEDKQEYYRVDYSQFIGDEGTRLAAFASSYESEPHEKLNIGNTVVEKQTRRNNRVSVGVTHPFVASANESLTATARVYTVDDERKYYLHELVGSVHLRGTLKTETDLRALALEGQWRKSDEERLRIVSGGLYKGVDALGADSKIVNASGMELPGQYDVDFMRLRLSAIQSDRFGEHWQGVASAALYLSGDDLPDSEQVIFGGQNFGRGYPNDQGYGDKGWGLAYELNRSYVIDGTLLRRVQPYAVLDVARAWFNSNNSLGASDLSSFAFGLRLSDLRYYNMALEVAKPLADKARDSNSRDPRMGVSLSYQL